MVHADLLAVVADLLVVVAELVQFNNTIFNFIFAISVFDGGGLLEFFIDLFVLNLVGLCAAKGGEDADDLLGLSNVSQEREENLKDQRDQAGKSA